MKLSKNGFIISCSPNPIILTETKIKIIKLVFDIKIDFENQILVIFVNSWSSERMFNHKNN